MGGSWSCLPLRSRSPPWRGWGPHFHRPPCRSSLKANVETSCKLCGRDIVRRTAGGRMKDIVVIGAGKIGASVAGLLVSTGDYQVTLADRSPEILGNLDRDERIRIVAADVEDSLRLVDLLNGQFAVLNAAPFRLTKHNAEAARAAGTHYLDLTEDVVSTRRVRELAVKANTAFIPQCGLAPGFVSIVAFDFAKGFQGLDSVRLRVGALPQYPSNALNYNLTWSTDGVINEYCE